jgi:hypothetical protein
MHACALTCTGRRSKNASEPIAAQGAVAIDICINVHRGFNIDRVGKKGFAANFNERTTGCHDAGARTQVDHDLTTLHMHMHDRDVQGSRIRTRAYIYTCTFQSLARVRTRARQFINYTQTERSNATCTYVHVTLVTRPVQLALVGQKRRPNIL